MKHVLIIAYNRIDYLNRLIRSLRNQKSYTSDYKLWFVIDYSEIQSEIIECIKNSNLAFEFEIIARDVNYGLKKNVIESVTEIFEKIDSQQLIYLEDDLVLSPFHSFLVCAYRLIPNNLSRSNLARSTASI